MSGASNELVREFRLPIGYCVTFQFSRPDNLAVTWSPAPPRIRNRRAWRRFANAYRIAGRAFIEEMAAWLGGNIAIIDMTRDLQTGEAVEVILPPVRH